MEEIKTQYPTFDFNYDKHGLSIRFSKEFLLLKVYILLFKETVGFKFVLSIYKEEFQNLSSFSESVHMHQQSVLPKLKPVRVLLGEHSLEYLLFKKKSVVRNTVSVIFSLNSSGIYMMRGNQSSLNILRVSKHLRR